MEIVHLQTETAQARDRCHFFRDMLQNMQTAYAAQNSRWNLAWFWGSAGPPIAKADLQSVECKLEQAEAELATVSNDYKYKVNASQAQLYAETKDKLEETKEKKRQYSQLICDYIQCLVVPTNEEHSQVSA